MNNLQKSYVFKIQLISDIGIHLLLNYFVVYNRDNTTKDKNEQFEIFDKSFHAPQCLSNSH